MCGPLFGYVYVKVDLLVRRSGWVLFGCELDRLDDTQEGTHPLQGLNGSSTIRGFRSPHQSTNTSPGLFVGSP